MTINEAEQTCSLISRTNKDNLILLSLFTFSQQRAFIRPRIAHLSTQAKGQTHHLNKPDSSSFDF